MKKLIFLILVFSLFTGVIFKMFENATPSTNIFQKKTDTIITPTVIPTLPPTPETKIIKNDYHIFQTFNNCGPAALSMALSYYGISINQGDLGLSLRPFQVTSGINDDKSVTLEELSEKSKEYGLIPYLRPMGNIEIIINFVSNDIPVIVRTWTKKDEDIGHFRIIKGYDNADEILVQDDSLQGKNLEYSYSDFNEIWKKFNYEYLVLIPKEKLKLAQQIIGEYASKNVAWAKAASNSENELAVNPNDIYARFNLSVALYNLGDYKRSTEEFEKVENLLPFRTLWYQIEPITAYYKLGNHSKVLEITEGILNNQNKAFSELYILRGKIYKDQGNSDLARNEFEKAVFYNSNLKEAKTLLDSI